MQYYWEKGAAMHHSARLPVQGFYMDTTPVRRENAR